MKLDSKAPEGPLKEKWSKHKKEMKLVAPNNKRKYEVIVVGTGLAGGAAAASMAELGYNVKSFCIQDSARRAHSIAAQGGINAAKNYPNDGDSIWRLFYDTIKGGDYRSRESNVYRLAEVANEIIDQAVAQGVPFAREYSGLLANRSFGGAQVSRTFYARGQTGQQLLLGAYQAMMRQVNEGGIEYHPRHEMLEVVIIDGKARGIITRDLVSGELKKWEADAVVLATGGYGNVFYLSTNAKNSNVTAAWRAHRKGALFANPCYVQVHPTCIPVSGDYQSKLTLMSESLRNDGRVWVPRKKGDDRHPNDIPDEERFYYLEEKYPSFGNLVPRDVASRNAKIVCDEGLGVGPTGLSVYLDFRDVIKRDGKETVASKYGNLFDMYQNIAGENPYEQPMRIYPAVHYTMGGLWVDYNLMTNIPGLFATGEANFSDHGANRLGASALMQGLSDGYFVLPATIGNYLADVKPGTRYGTDHDAFTAAAKEAQDNIDKLLNINGKRTIVDFHRTLGKIVWDNIGIARNEEDLKKAIKEIQELREEFWTNVYVPGEKNNYNKYLEFAGRVADFFELAELMAKDALERKESCGCHLREEYQSEEGEAIRNDEEFSYVAAWEFKGVNGELQEELHKENLEFEFVELKQRSYK
ncbi:MAG: fumarate reductase/succinate dehydrogenase flavoprotein subunit [Balneola sp.]